ncbi:stress protein, partial [Kineococcus sp. R8]
VRRGAAAVPHPAAPLRTPPARTSPPRAAPPGSTPLAPPPAAEVGRARVSEERLVLDDDAPVTTITAAQREGGTLRILLQWERQVTSRGLQRSTDVHLGCLWETQDRHRGAVQSLGDLLMAPGYGARQVLRLGPRSEEAGEELLVDGRHLDVVRRMVLYVYATHDAPDFAALAPHLTVRRRDGGRLQAWAQGAPPGARTCALVSVHNVGGDLVVRRENEFFPGPQAEVAAAYGFDDLDWGPGGTVPRPA